MKCRTLYEHRYFLCVFPLKTGCFVLGFTNLILSCGKLFEDVLVLGLWDDIRNNYMEKDPDILLEMEGGLKFLYGLMIIELLIYVCSVLNHIMLFVTLFKDYSKLLSPFVTIEIIITVMLSIIILTINISHSVMVYHNILLLINNIVSLYLIVMVYSYNEYLKCPEEVYPEYYSVFETRKREAALELQKPSVKLSCSVESVKSSDQFDQNVTPVASKSSHRRSGLWTRWKKVLHL